MSDDSSAILLASEKTEPDSSSSSYYDELSIILKSAIPVAIGFFCTTGLDFFNIYFLNQVTTDSNVVDGYSLGNNLNSLLTFSIIYALNQGLTARVSQSYGKKQYHLCGLLLHRGIIINLAITLPVLVPLFFGDKICEALGTNPEIAENAQQFLWGRIPGSIPTVLFYTLTAFFNGCKNFIIPGVIYTISSLICFFFTWFLTVKLDMVVLGVGIASSLNWAIALLLLIIYIWLKDPLPGMFFGLRKESFQDIWPLLKYEIIVGAMLWFDYAATQMTGLVSASFPPHELYGYAVAGNLILITLPVAYSISLAATTHIGYAMGSKNVARGKKFLKAAILLGIVTSIFFVTIGVAFSGTLVGLLTSKPSTFDAGVSIYRAYVFFVPVFTMTFILNAAVKTIGKENIGAISVALCDGLIQLPLALTLTLKAGLGPYGLIIAVISSYTCKTGGCYLILSKTKWENQLDAVQKAIKDLNHGEELENEKITEEDSLVM